jgi:predicted RNase H-like nuclease (RuvC/YqgF family)
VTETPMPEDRQADPARALEEAIARRERELEELARDFDRIEDELDAGESDAEIARLIDLHAAEIARPRRGFGAATSGAAQSNSAEIDREGPSTLELERRLQGLEALQQELRSRLEQLRVGQENLDRKIEGGFAALIEAQRRDLEGDSAAVARGGEGLAAFRSSRHRARLALYGAGLLLVLLLWRWLAL